MASIQTFLLVIAILIISIYAISKLVLTESFILDKIYKVINNDNFDEAALQQTEDLLYLITIAPDSIEYNITGSKQIMSDLYYSIRNVTPDEARQRVNIIFKNLIEETQE